MYACGRPVMAASTTASAMPRAPAGAVASAAAGNSEGGAGNEAVASRPGDWSWSPDAAQGKCQLLHPATPHYPSRRGTETKGCSPPLLLSLC